MKLKIEKIKEIENIKENIKEENNKEVIGPPQFGRIGDKILILIEPNGKNNKFIIEEKTTKEDIIAFGRKHNINLTSYVEE